MANTQLGLEGLIDSSDDGLQNVVEGGELICFKAKEAELGAVLLRKLLKRLQLQLHLDLVENYRMYSAS
jgi:hypothetical protein